MVHKCIRCKADYESQEEDAYYCESCARSKEAIAKEIDKKFANRPKKHVPNFNERIKQLPKIPGTNIPYIQ